MSVRIVSACILVMLLCFVRLNVGSTSGGEGSVIRVPDDYATIAWAVGNATAGDTILVAPGFYAGNVAVNKPLSIFGESTGTTVVDGGGHAWNDTTVGFRIVSSNVTVGNLTVQNAWTGISVEKAENVTLQDNLLILNQHGADLNECREAEVKDNTVTNNTYGIILSNCSHCTIADNDALHNWAGGPDLYTGGGIDLMYSNNTYVTDNLLFGNMQAILLGDSHNNTIASNVATGGGAEISVASSHNNTIFNNTLTSGGMGIIFDSCSNLVKGNFFRGGGIGTGGMGNVFFGNVMVDSWLAITMEGARDLFVGNLIMNCSQGINIHYSNGSTFYHNVLINNTIHFPRDVYVNNNTFDNGFEGNYWDNYTGVDADQDGIGDTAHQLDDYNMDRHPLMAPISIFDVGTWNGTEQQVRIISNSTVTDFQLNTTTGILSFNVTGETPTTCFSRITIPNVIIEQLWSNNYTVLVDNAQPTFVKNWTDATSTHIYVTHQHSTHEIVIITEYLSITIALLLTSTATLFILLKRKRLRH